METAQSPAEVDEKQQSKRKPYVRRACLACKKRKTRCDGAQPCARCAAADLCCSYPEGRWAIYPQNPVKLKKQHRSEPRPVRIQSTTSSTAETQENTTVIRSQVTKPNSSLFPSDDNLAFGDWTDLVRERLDMMHAPAFMAANSSLDQPIPLNLPYEPVPHDPIYHLLTTDPLWNFSREYATQLINQWCDGDGLLYPVLNRPVLLAKANDILLPFEYARKHSIRLGKVTLMEALFNRETIELKLVLAIALTHEGGQMIHKAKALEASVREVVNTLIIGHARVEDIQTLFLAALYHYHTDNEPLSSRMIAIAARSCLELGLHRQSTQKKESPSSIDRCASLRVFWSVYMLERRTSLCQGMPFTIQDAYIDPFLFTNDLRMSTSCGYPVALEQTETALPALLDWAKLSGNAWQAIHGFDRAGSGFSLDKIDHLDYQIVQWYDSLSVDLEFSMPWLRLDHIPKTPTFIQAALYFQKYQLRNLIYKPILQSSEIFDQNKSRVQLATKLARDTLQTLADLNEKTPLVRDYPIFFKQPLLSALFNLLFIVVNGGPMAWTTTRDEIGIGLTLLQLLSTKSTSLMQIWESLKRLQDLQMSILDPVVDELLSDYLEPSEDTCLDFILSEEDFTPQLLE